MLNFIKNWFNTISTKVVKETYGDGSVVYRGYVKYSRFGKWEKIADYNSWNPYTFDHKEEVDILIKSEVNKRMRERLIKSEII